MLVLTAKIQPNTCLDQTGPFFRKICLSDATYFDITPRADSDDEANVLNSAQDAGVRDENLH